MYKLNEVDIENLESLILTEKYIFSNYKKIDTEDRKNGNNSKPFLLQTHILKLNLESEEKLLKKLSKSVEQIDAVIDKLNEMINESFYKNTYVLDLAPKDDVMVIERIVNKLIKIRLDIINKMPIDDIEESLLRKSDCYISTFSNYLISDVINLALTIIAKDYPEFTFKKYDYIYTNPTIEENFIDNNFAISSSPYISNGIVNVLFPNIYTDEESYIDISLLRIISTELGELASFSNEDFKDEKKKGNFIFSLSVIRSCFALIRPENSFEVVEGFKRDLDRLSQIDSQSEVIEYLCDIIYKYESDRNIGRFLKMGRL